MAENTKIEWCDATWNALRGCSRVSEGCRNCYAEGMAARFCGPGLWGHGIANPVAAGGHWTGKVVLNEKALVKPLHWKKPRRIFVTSIGDPFHPRVTDDMLDRMFAVMAMCPQHIFQCLTKRPERMREYINRVLAESHSATVKRFAQHLGDFAWPKGWTGMDWPLPNVWIGTSVENQTAADERIPHLLATPAAVRFLSCEPLLGPVRLTNMDINRHIASRQMGRIGGYWINALTGENDDMGRPCPDVPRLDWIIAGGESGRKARPMHPDWVRSLRDQCAAAGVPFLFKQWGEWKHTPERAHFKEAYREPWKRQESGMDGVRPALMFRVGKKTAGRLLDGVEYNAFPVAAE